MAAKTGQPDATGSSENTADATPPGPALSKAEALAQVLALPEALTVQLDAAGVVNKLESAARRGKLAGFEARPRGTNLLFRVDAFGTPFEGWLEARESAAASGGTVLTFSRSLKPAWPWGFAIVMVLSVWPGVVLTESLLAAMVPSWGWLWKTTWYWYIPLSVIGGVYGVYEALKRSRLTVAASSHEAADNIATLLRS